LFCFQAEDGIRDFHVTGVQTCALPILRGSVFTALKGGGAAETSQAYARTVELRQDDEDPDTQFLLMWGAWQVALSTRPHNESLQIGRAACRERMESGSGTVGSDVEVTE